MANFNKVILMGNLTRDPVLKFLPSGSAVCEFGIAINRTWMDQNSGEKREAVTFVDCRVMGKQAETFNNYMKKGRPVMIEGRLDYHTWEKDGQKRSKLDVFVEGFQFVGTRPQDGSGPAPERPGPSSAQPRSSRVAQGGGGDQAFDSGGPAPETMDDDVPF